MIAEAITQLDAARGLVYLAARAVDSGAPNARRLVSKAKKFGTEMSWDVREVLGQAAQFRDFEGEATGGDGSEKCFTDEDTWRVHEETAAVTQTDG